MATKFEIAHMASRCNEAISLAPSGKGAGMRPKDEYIAAAFHEAANEESANTEWWKVCIDIYDRARELQSAADNPARTKCPKCPNMMVNPRPCMNSDCGFRK